MQRTDRAPLAAFLTDESLVAGGSISLGEDAARHIKVLRLGAGAAVELRSGAGRVASGTLLRVSKNHAVVEVLTTDEIQPPLPIHILAPIADRERMLWLAEKCTEFGIASWRPVMWKRSRSVSPRGEGSGFQQKVRLRMASALLQSRGGWLSEMYPDATVDRAIAAAPPGTRLLLDCGTDPGPVAMPAVPLTAPVSIAVGPEGGIERTERELFLAAGFIPVSLGATVLRFETAGVGAVAIARAMLSITREKP